MKFEKLRKLENNVFTSKIVRVEDENQDCVLEDKVLENDFGPVCVEAGGKFEAIVTKDSHSGKLKFEALTSKNSGKADQVNLAFAKTKNKVSLLMGTALEHSCNAKEETSREFEGVVLTAKQVAEMQCKIFEEVILDRIEVAIEEWKANKTDFETEILDPVHFSLV